GVDLFKVDTKAAVKPFNLIVEVGRCYPRTIYVLCRYLEGEDRCTLIGWEWGKVLLKTTPRDFGFGILTHWRPAATLRGFEELDLRVVPRELEWMRRRR